MMKELVGSQGRTTDEIAFWLYHAVTIIPVLRSTIARLTKQKDTPGRAFQMTIRHWYKQPFLVQRAQANNPLARSLRPPCPTRFRVVFGGEQPELFSTLRSRRLLWKGEGSP
jgi:hypothetical protein